MTVVEADTSRGAPDEPIVSGELVTAEQFLIRPEWMSDALCRKYERVNFFPHIGESSAAAKAVCRACPVCDECLAYALATHEPHGIWGGTTGKDRKRMNRERGGSRRARPARQLAPG